MKILDSKAYALVMRKEHMNQFTIFSSMSAVTKSTSYRTTMVERCPPTAGKSPSASTSVQQQWGYALIGDQ